METITFNQRGRSNLTYAKFSPELQFLLDNWRGTGQVRLFKGHLFITDTASHFAMQLMIRSRIPFRIVTELTTRQTLKNSMP